MNKKINSLEMFNIIFNDLISKGYVVPFREEWNNGTGYLDGAAEGRYALKLSPSSMVATISTNGRKVIMVGTREGNMVVFERFTACANGNQLIVSNQARGLLAFSGIRNGGLSPDQVAFILGTPDNPNNIGHYVDSLKEE